MQEINKKRGPEEQIQKENEVVEKTGQLYKNLAKHAREDKEFNVEKNRDLINDLRKLQRKKPKELKSKIKLDEQTASVFLTVKGKNKD